MGEPRTPAAPDGPPVATVDIDGVLADVRHRLHHLQSRPKDWDAFFAAAPDDALLPEGEAVAHRLAADHSIVYLTGRPERCRADTLAWLRDHGLPEGRLVMRPDTDRRPSRQFKTDAVRRLQRQGTVVAIAVDDDAAVVAALRRADVPVLHAEWMSDQPTLFDAQETEGRT